YLVRDDQVELKQKTLQQLCSTGANVREISAQEVINRVPCVRTDGLHGAIEEVDAKDLDVHALLQGFLKGARQAGVEFAFGVKVTGAEWQADHWAITLSDGRRMQAATVVNAAGAWAQQVAQQFRASHVGLQPKRRTAFTFKAIDAQTNESIQPEVFEKWPAVVGIDESYYFKPDAGQLLGSPANADPVEPQDAAPEELDVALGIYNIEAMTTLQIRRPSHSWAGLRSFVADGDLVIGFDPRMPAFFWLAAQGGYGIQSAAGASRLAADLLLGQPLCPSLLAQGVSPEQLSPARFPQP